MSTLTTYLAGMKSDLRTKKAEVQVLEKQINEFETLIKKQAPATKPVAKKAKTTKKPARKSAKSTKKP